MSRPFCAICLRCVLPLRSRQLDMNGPIFQLCRRCDEQDAVTIRCRRAQYRTPYRGQSGGWQRKTYTPIDESECDLAFRILRTVQRFDWISSVDLSEVLGIPSCTADRVLRNNYSVMLSRLARKKFLRRRYEHPNTEYQITRLGLSRIENLERAAVEAKESIAA